MPFVLSLFEDTHKTLWRSTRKSDNVEFSESGIAHILSNHSDAPQTHSKNIIVSLNFLPDSSPLPAFMCLWAYPAR
jgi:hypothetical protein